MLGAKMATRRLSWTAKALWYRRRRWHEHYPVLFGCHLRLGVGRQCKGKGISGMGPELSLQGKAAPELAV